MASGTGVPGAPFLRYVCARGLVWPTTEKHPKRQSPAVNINAEFPENPRAAENENSAVRQVSSV